jgi:hypothetical protein
MTLLLSVNENDAKRVSIGIIYQCIHQLHRLTAPRLNDREREIWNDDGWSDDWLQNSGLFALRCLEGSVHRQTTPLCRVLENSTASGIVPNWRICWHRQRFSIGDVHDEVGEKKNPGTPRIILVPWRHPSRKYSRLKILRRSRRSELKYLLNYYEGSWKQ